MVEKSTQPIQEMMTLSGRILEIADSGATVNVPVDPKIDASILTAGDANPMFVNIETIRTGVSKTNRRRYNNQVVKEISEMTPGLQGYLGHPDPSKMGFEFREPQCIYVGSMVQEMADGGSRSIAKAYILETSPLRNWVPKSLAARNPLTVSINGMGDIIKNGDILDVLHISELQSIDWANPGTEGMSTSTALSVVNEMQNNEGGNTMDAKDILKNSTIAEFRAYNPDGYNGMVKGITLTELQAGNPELVKQIQESGRITEMQLVVGGKQQVTKLADIQGIIGANEAKIAELQGKVDAQAITELRSKKVAELVPEGMRAAVLKRVTGNTEAEIKTSIDNEIAYIREIGGSIDNPPAGEQRRTGGDDIKNDVLDLFGVKRDKK